MAASSKATCVAVNRDLLIVATAQCYAAERNNIALGAVERPLAQALQRS